MPIIDKYKKAYLELYEIINNLEKDEQEKIPKEFINTLKINMDSNYEFKYDSQKPLLEQKILDETKALLVILYQKYLAKPEEKDYWNNYNLKCIENEENKKRKRYNTDDIFKNKSIKSIDTSENINNISLVEYKESFFTQFKNFIFKILHINIE